MKMKAIIIMSVVGLLSTSISYSQIKNAKTETITIYGNCGMCETTIEKAGSKSKMYKTDWNVDTKMASITYDGKKTTADAVLKIIALSGYDNASFLAPDEAYNKLDGCCKYERKNKTAIANNNMATGNAMQGHTAQGHENKTMIMQQPSQLKAVFDNYFILKDALVKTDGSTASASGAALLTALDAVEMGKLKTDEHTVWMKVEKALKSDAQHIKENKDTEHQREHFMALSKNIYELIKVTKPAEVVYYQFCPMANDGKGANWLSKESTIKNPYYGSQMLSCGKVIETIKQ
jgi:copper chaperone CopZ